MTSTVVSPTAQATLKQVADYFRLPGQTLKAFTEEWKLLSDEDKEQLKSGLGNGSMTY
jgi:hypothetical protein